MLYWSAACKEWALSTASTCSPAITRTSCRVFRYPADAPEAQVTAARRNGSEVITVRFPMHADQRAVRRRALQDAALRASLGVRT
ncbi:hypothetical protein AVL59_29385 [Streptomyces griseochromogenes]|uniref:Uncharacterized protein n=1 Tax=Streptomyces griseochromogenes TaxID=68214 RepID=A0A1B1B2Q9_9ACTN|nr:hypothetical protein AVL59_29385 [Streptomyces griseochromogenes]